MFPADQSLQRLQEGNLRFAAGTGKSHTLVSQLRRTELLDGQQPFAIILGCSDSRVPAELIFDQGLGELFVIRIAGNIVAPSQIGSIEFAAEQFSTRLVVVLGHSHCGAVSATLDSIMQPTAATSRHVHSIVERIRPSVEPLLETELRHDHDALIRHAVRANVRASVNQLRHGSRLLEDLVMQQKLLIVGAEYSLETGIVDFFDKATLGD